MLDVRYTLEPHHLIAYQYAVRDAIRSESSASLFGMEWVRLAAFIPLGLLAFAGASSFVVWATGSWPNPRDLFIGFALGAVLFLGMVWTSYLTRRQHLVRKEGPTLSPHTLRLSEAGVEISRPLIRQHFEWPIFTRVSEGRGLILLWLEPSQAVVIPDVAFASSSVRDEFLRYARARITSPT